MNGTHWHDIKWLITAAKEAMHLLMSICLHISNITREDFKLFLWNLLGLCTYHDKNLLNFVADATENGHLAAILDSYCNVLLIHHMQHGGGN